jgi:hypothetical protein
MIVSLILSTLHKSFAQPISSRELIENAKMYDGKLIEYEGEVIGDVMKRGDFVWINLHDGKGTIGVWAKKDMAKVIEYRGNYRFKGDWLRVKGIFNRSCSEHGGDLDIHAISLDRIESGREIKERLIFPKLNLSMKLGGVLLCLIILRRFLRRQKKR